MTNPRLIAARGAASAASALVVVAMLVLPGIVRAQMRQFALESADGLLLQDAVAEPATLAGLKGVRVSAAGPRAREMPGTPRVEIDALAVVRGLRFSSGTIEAEIAGVPAEGGGNFPRGFVGIAFRVQDDLKTYDAFYLRPTNGRADDQERRNHSAQYISHPEWTWSRLRRENPSRYESYVDLVPNQWTRVRLDIDGARARLYVHDQEQPTLIVNDLKSGADAAGGIALWAGPGGVTHFRNLVVRPR